MTMLYLLMILFSVFWDAMSLSMHYFNMTHSSQDSAFPSIVMYWDKIFIGLVELSFFNMISKSLNEGCVIVGVLPGLRCISYHYPYKMVWIHGIDLFD